MLVKQPINSIDNPNIIEPYACILLPESIPIPDESTSVITMLNNPVLIMSMVSENNVWYPWYRYTPRIHLSNNTSFAMYSSLYGPVGIIIGGMGGRVRWNLNKEKNGIYLHTIHNEPLNLPITKNCCS